MINNLRAAIILVKLYFKGNSKNLLKFDPEIRDES